MISNGKKSSVRFLIRISVSVLALEEYNTLQQRYALETQCRVEAEKYAAEVGNLSDGGRGGGVLRTAFAGFGSMVSLNPYSITTYSLANYGPHLSHFWYAVTAS